MIKPDLWEPAYVGNKTTKRKFRFQPGVYLIKDSFEKMVYIGKSNTCLYKALYRHFQKWDDPKFPRLTYEGKRHEYKVKCILMSNGFVNYFEARLINSFKPRDNKDFCEHINNPDVYKELFDLDSEPLPF